MILIAYKLSYERLSAHIAISFISVRLTSTFLSLPKI